MLVESVPNVSEGRRIEVVDRLAAAVGGVAGVFLLDRTSDPSHNRSVFTLAGEHGPVSDALAALIAESIHEIDMEAHSGEHPRIGAVDVVPFVPLGDTTLAQCVELARAFGERVATDHDLPVYLYAAAAQRPERVKLADVRRGQYEGLKAEIAHRGREPDFGPSRMHPRAGAVAVGARPFLIAWNVNLESEDVDLAKRIARRVRESGGGLPAVQALGMEVAEPERGNPRFAQVSMNLLDFRRTPVWQVFDAVQELANEEGVAVEESELIGLMPQEAFLAIADHADVPTDGPLEERIAEAAGYIKLRDFDPRMALELRLAAAQTGQVR